MVASTESTSPSSLPPECSRFDPSILAALESKSHLHRERALGAILSALSTTPAPSFPSLKPTLLSRLIATRPWEAIYGALKAAALVVAHSPDDPVFASDALRLALPLISHGAERVRAAASALFGVLARHQGATVWHAVAPSLLARIRDSARLDERQRLREAAAVAESDADVKAGVAKLKGVRMVHETEGWCGLETSMLALADILRGCGAELLVGGVEGVEGMQEMIGVVVSSREHPNRFVREAGLHLLNSLAEAAVVGADDGGAANVLERVAKTCVRVIESGLQDNWSQVRYAASETARTVLEGLPQEKRRELYPRLLPRMCLNRHYVAEGVRNLSLETWRKVIAEDGKKFLLTHLDECIGFYETQCVADNHAVREAACQGLAELFGKLDHSAMEPHVTRVLEGLVGCFKDESWPVRDHACRALGSIVARFSAAAERSGRLRELFALFEEHLADNIPSVRANCADAFAQACVAFDASHPTFGAGHVVASAKRLLARLRAQPPQRFGAADSAHGRDRDSGYGAASKLARDNDAALHTNQITYSCGSLAPKLRRGAGCMDHGFARAKLPWEEADGGLRLWTALARQGVPEAWSMVDEIVAAGEFGARLPFAQEMCVREGWLSCFEEAVRGGRLEGETVVRVVGVVELCREMENQSVRAAATACARAVRRVVGLGVYARAEAEAKKRMSEDHKALGADA